MSGYTTTDLTVAPLADEVIVNRNGATARQRVADLSTQLAGDGPLAEQLDDLRVLASGEPRQLVPADIATTAAIALTGAQTIDGIATGAGKRVLVKDQADATQNGVWVTSAGAWARATDLDAAAEFAHASIYVTAGTVNRGTTWMQIASVSAVGSSAVSWRKIKDEAGLQAELATKASQVDLFAGAVWFCSAVAGTANEIAVTATGAPSPTNGMRVKFTAAADNTGPVTIAVNGGGAFNARLANGGPLAPGDIKSGYVYEAQFIGIGNVWRISAHPQDRDIYRKLYAKASAVGGTANAITVTADMPIADGILLYLIPASTNTSATVTLAYNGGTKTEIRKRGQPLVVGDLVAGRGVLLRYVASGGHPWEIIGDGVTAADVGAIAAALTALDARVVAFEGAVGRGQFASEATALMEKINGPSPNGAGWAASQRNPDNFFTWTEGVRTQAAPLEIKICGFGSSIDTGAGADDGGASAPARVLCDRLISAFGYMRNITATPTIVAVGGQAVNQFLAQITAAGAGDYDIIVGGNNMNSGGISGAAGAATMSSIYDDYVEIIQEIRSVRRNAMPIITGTFHPHTHYVDGVTSPQQFPDNYRSGWPASNTTYQVTGNHIFDGVSKTIALVNINLYGRTLAIGDKLVVASGPAAGTYTVAAIDWATGLVTVDASLTYSGTYSVQVSNLFLDEERVVWPANSQRLVRLDRTGNGVPLLGWRTYDEQNRIIQRACADQGAMYINMQRLQYLFLEQKWATGAYTDATLMNSMYQQGGLIQWNHPNLEFYNFAGGRAYGSIARFIQEGTLHQHREIG